MSGLELFVLSAALGTDLFSVSIPIGMRPVRWLIILRAAMIFAVFHIVMILTGYHAGHWLGMMLEQIGTYHTEYPHFAVENWASILGALVLAALGIHMIKENLFGSCDAAHAKGHPLRGLTLAMLAFSVSVDALAAGFSMGMMDVDLIRLSMILGMVIFCIAVVGLGLGRRIGRYMGARSEIVGGAILILLAVHVLWTTVVK